MRNREALRPCPPQSERGRPTPGPPRAAATGAAHWDNSLFISRPGRQYRRDRRIRSKKGVSMVNGQRALARGLPGRQDLPDPDEGGDAELLGRFAHSQDEAAFAALVRRHGPMVWGVVRRVLN